MTDTSAGKLQEIFRVVFELPDSADVTGVRQIGEGKCDSLAHMSLVAAIESEFGVSIDAVDALRMTSFQATQLMLEERGL
jgi:acyl carrier protein